MPEDDLNWLTENKNAAQQYSLPLYLGLGGLILLAVGYFIFTYYSQSDVQMEVVSSPTETIQTIMVDLQGAVEKPGVYEMKTGDRIQDLLIKAGGLSAEADRDWVNKNLNLALKLSDSAKIWIPSKSETQTVSVVAASSQTLVAGTSITDKININSASLNDLDTLSGIGSARAQAIINNRPYTTIDDLVSKKVITKSVFEKIKERITVY